MSLSDEVISTPTRLTALRNALRELAERVGAEAAFLVDEHGTPFATVGHIEFAWPNPLTALDGSDAVLHALVGESGPSNGQVHVKRLSDRALLAVVRPAEAESGSALRRGMDRAAKQLAPLL